LDVHDPTENRAKLQTLTKLVIEMLLHKWHDVSSFGGELLASHRDYVAWLVVSHSVSKSISQLVTQSGSQEVSQSVNHSENQLVGQSVNQLDSRSVRQSVSERVIQSIIQPTSQSFGQSVSQIVSP